MISKPIIQRLFGIIQFILYSISNYSGTAIKPVGNLTATRVRKINPLKRFGGFKRLSKKDDTEGLPVWWGTFIMI